MGNTAWGSGRAESPVEARAWSQVEPRPASVAHFPLAVFAAPAQDRKVRSRRCRQTHGTERGKESRFHGKEMTRVMDRRGAGTRGG